MKDNRKMGDFTVNFNEYMPLRDLVYTTLRQAILKGELQPGERLMEIQLADKLGVSRTPIREAIRRLEKEGLVTMIPRKGAEVAAISEKMLKDVLEIRMTLEKLALSLAITRASAGDVEALAEAEEAFRGAVDSAELIAMAESDEHFHFIIYRAANNGKLIEILESLKENMYRYRLEYLKDENYRKDLMQEHETIIKAFRERDMETGIRMTEQHIENQERAVLQRVRQEALENEKKPRRR